MTNYLVFVIIMWKNKEKGFSPKMTVREVTAADISACNEIYENARLYMRRSGNLEQWAGVYPGTSDIKGDMARGTSYLVDDGGEIVAVFHFHLGDDPTYGKIYGGEWKNPDPYGVIHRIAVKHHGRGIADMIYGYCFAKCGNLKIDTHKDNTPMQRSLEKNGFEYCGIIHLATGEERMAYQKTR